ncbi:MAG: ORC1-type DNA replication protein [Promethearchaeota archaeon]
MFPSIPRVEASDGQAKVDGSVDQASPVEAGAVQPGQMEFDVNAYFDAIFSTPKIFKNRDVLWPSFVPDELLHRDSEIKKIAASLGYALTNSTPANLFVYGKTGTGKTVVIRYVLRALSQNCQRRGITEPLWVYVNCQEVNTSYRVFARIYNAVVTKLSKSQPHEKCEKIPFTGLPTDEVFKKLVRLLDGEVKSLLFVVLDEADILAKRNGSEVFYLLGRINSILKHARVCLIGVSNVLDFKEHLDARAAGTLLEDEILFPPYDSTQLGDILQARVPDAFQEGACTEVVVALCAALAAKEHGDARKALDLLRRAGELADREGANAISESHVLKAYRDRSEGTIRQYLKELPLQMKTLLTALYLVHGNGVPRVKSGDLYDAYREVAQVVTGVNPLTPRRITDLVKELSINGIIHAKLVSLGRGGRFRVVELKIQADLVEELVLSEDRLRHLITFVPRVAKLAKTKLVKFANKLIRPLF